MGATSSFPQHYYDFVVDIPAIASVISALGIGSFIGQYLIGAQQRRQLRSEVLKHLAQTETVRWASTTTIGPGFRESIRELEAAALVSQIPQRVVEQYTIFAYTAWWESNENWEAGGGDEEDAGIDRRLADLVQEAAIELSAAAWSPWTSKFRRGSRLKKRISRAENIDDPRVTGSLARAQNARAACRTQIRVGTSDPTSASRRAGADSRPAGGSIWWNGHT
ncbi:hypothetical protein NVV99_24010 [Rhodococcus sp. PAE-6]|uniref:hypothetical protein n=1 Tax=unclassified Rhodococcus (in: high G+C Gram-positive bacteria) TaxID=192944 RepID=UPI0012F4E817|nr:MULTISPECIES: hypothetical protein [unclassified Rhodococcus (in: high G+C Gram-positive bacteria)]MCT7293968.1 hypothetical protein [Rhodococcus sp. PAE-6]